jgi:hypothetical protein
MMAALIFVISMAAVIQFAVFSWRAGLLSFSAEPLSETLKSAAEPFANPLNPKDFRVFAALQGLCPDLAPQRSHELWHVRLYYCTLEKLNSVAPAFGSWSQREMATCTRYIAVELDQRLQRNLACLADVRSY